MNSSRTVSHGVTVLLFAGITLAAAGWFVAIRFRPVPPPPDAELTVLAGEAETLRDNTDAEVGFWQKRRNGMQHLAWTQPAIDEFASGSGWDWDWTAPDRVTVRPVELSLDGWPGYLGFIERLAVMPGVKVESIEVRASGSGQQRRLTEYRVGLRFIRTEATTGGGARAVPNPGPPPAASAELPTPPRKVGPGPPLRRPSASTEPPAPGPDFAPSRPDPPGSRAGIPPTTNRIKPNSP